MIGYLKGRVVAAAADRLIVDVNGVGYEVLAPTPVLARAAVGGEQELELFVHTHVADAKLELYGFFDAESRDAFRHLIGISGVGPRSALGVLSVMDVDELRRAIVMEDSRAIQRAPGIGKKIAGRIVLELAEKGIAASTLPTVAPKAGRPRDPIREDAVMALKALGFPPRNAIEAVEQVLRGKERPGNIEATVAEALQVLTGR
jgi:holliday junction DNA helicase RuvA